MLFNDIALFVTVAQHLSFSEAADELSIPVSRVSRRVAELEDKLGIKLLERTTRSVRLTEEGRQLLDRCQMPVELLREAGGSVSEAIKPTIRVTAPSLASRTVIGPKLLDYAEQNPGLSIDLLTTNSNLDFIRDNIDLAFRLGPITDETLIAKPLWPVPYTFCVGEKFFRNHVLNKVISRECLLQLPSVMYGKSWLVGAGSALTPSQVAHNFDDLELVMEAVSRNMGVALLPAEMLSDDVMAITVEEVVPVKRIMHVVYPSRRLLPSRVRRLIDHISVFR